MNKKKIIIPIIASIVTLALLVGVSYAYFSATITENNKTETVIKSGELNLIFTGTSEITAGDMIPGDSFTKTFTVKIHQVLKHLIIFIWKESLMNLIKT